MSTAILEMTRTALAEIKSPTDLYRLQINLQQFATPDEMAALVAEQRNFPQEFKSWLGAMSGWMSDVRKEFPAYERRMIGDHMTLYSGTKREHALVVGFCGKAGMLFMPMPLSLQYFSMGGCDLLVIRDPDRMGFVTGIPGYAPSLESLAEKLGADVDFGRYREVRTFGASGGGVAALVMGAILKAPRAASFSGHLPSISPRYGTHPGTVALEAALRASGPLPDYTCVFGAANGFDTTRAHEIARLAPLRLLPVEGVSDHNVMFVLHQKGQLAPLLKDVGLI